MTAMGSASDLALTGRRLTGVLPAGGGQKGQVEHGPWEAARPEDASSGGRGQEEGSRAMEDALCQHSDILQGRRPGAAGVGPCDPSASPGGTLTSALVESSKTRAGALGTSFRGLPAGLAGTEPAGGPRPASSRPAPGCREPMTDLPCEPDLSNADGSE